MSDGAKSAFVLALGGLLVAAVQPAASAGPTDQGRLKVSVQGLGNTPAHVKVIGPTGNHKQHVWKVKDVSKLTGLPKGVYAVVAPQVRKGSEHMVAIPSTQWVKVGTRPARITIEYATQEATSLIPYPVQITYMDAVCAFSYGPRSSAFYRDYKAPYSWYCKLGGQEVGGMDFDGYCQARAPKDAIKTEAMLRGNTVKDWWCVYWKKGGDDSPA